jgi:hypothetical protein
VASCGIVIFVGQFTVNSFRVVKHHILFSLNTNTEVAWKFRQWVCRFHFPIADRFEIVFYMEKALQLKAQQIPLIFLSYETIVGSNLRSREFIPLMTDFEL